MEDYIWVLPLLFVFLFQKDLFLTPCQMGMSQEHGKALSRSVKSLKLFHVFFYPFIARLLPGPLPQALLCCFLIAAWEKQCAPVAVFFFQAEYNTPTEKSSRSIFLTMLLSRSCKWEILGDWSLHRHWSKVQHLKRGRRQTSPCVAHSCCRRPT